MLQRPVSINDALEFAIVEFQKGTPFWPKLLVVYSEQVEKGGAFRFALQVYEYIAEHIGNDYVLKLVRELRNLLGSSDAADYAKLLDRSREIWEYPGDRSFIKRGTTRLFNALGHRLANQSDDYKAELMRALGMVVLDKTENPSEEHFNAIIDSFKKIHKE